MPLVVSVTVYDSPDAGAGSGSGKQGPRLSFLRVNCFMISNRSERSCKFDALWSREAPELRVDVVEHSICLGVPSRGGERLDLREFRIQFGIDGGAALCEPRRVLVQRLCKNIKCARKCCPVDRVVTAAQR